MPLLQVELCNNECVIVSKLKILFDAGPLVDNHKTGIGFYVERLISNLDKYYSSDLDIYGYYFSFIGRGPAQESLSYKHVRFKFFPGKVLNVLRRLGFQIYLELLTRKKYDVMVFTNYVMLPTLRKTKKVLFVYDLCFLDHPVYLRDANLAFLNKFAPDSIKSADSLVTISEFTKSRLLHYYPNLKDKIVVTPIPPKLNSEIMNELPERISNLGARKQKYILFIGTIEPRKNILNLLKAFALLDESVTKEYSLVIAGGSGWKNDSILEEIKSLRSSGLQIVQTGRVTDDEQVALYQNATCLVLPSHYEGFGMPILEAMQYQLPVAISDIDVFHEVAGDAAIYFDKDRPEDIADKLNNLVSNEELCSRLINKGNERLKISSWKDNADKVFDVINI